jgi:nicotinate dehydrogenase subunit A
VTAAFRLRINGSDHEVRAEPATALLYILRNDLKLYGTRFGCGNGLCGACFVLVDGIAVPACDTPLWSVVGKEIITIEGLGTPQAPHALQQAFIDEQAAQCGFCSSGMIISAAALLARNALPEPGVIRAALERNLCRCGTHNRIVRAVERASGAQHDP